jgi:hypothetical protein
MGKNSILISDAGTVDVKNPNVEGVFAKTHLF